MNNPDKQWNWGWLPNIPNIEDECKRVGYLYVDYKEYLQKAMTSCGKCSNPHIDPVNNKALLDFAERYANERKKIIDNKDHLQKIPYDVKNVEHMCTKYHNFWKNTNKSVLPQCSYPSKGAMIDFLTFHWLLYNTNNIHQNKEIVCEELPVFKDMLNILHHKSPKDEQLIREWHKETYKNFFKCANV